MHKNYNLIAYIIYIKMLYLYVYSQNALLGFTQVRNISQLPSTGSSQVYAIRMNSLTDAEIFASLLKKMTFIDVVRNVLVAQKSGMHV